MINKMAFLIKTKQPLSGFHWLTHLSVSVSVLQCVSLAVFLYLPVQLDIIRPHLLFVRSFVSSGWWRSQVR